MLTQSSEFLLRFHVRAVASCGLCFVHSKRRGRVLALAKAASSLSFIHQGYQLPPQQAVLSPYSTISTTLAPPSPPPTNLPHRRAPPPINRRIHRAIPTLPLTPPPTPPRRTMILNDLHNIILPLPLRRRSPRLLNNNRLPPRLPPRRCLPRHAPRSTNLADLGASGTGARPSSRRP